ncbi:MAG: hypothetical protein ACE10F_11985 [Candidatus Methylomirabilales bacterium]
MEWEMDAIIYRGFQIWLAQGRDGDWTASVNALPEQGAGFTAGPGEGHILGPFDSREAAIEGGKRYIDEKQQQR